MNKNAVSPNLLKAMNTLQNYFKLEILSFSRFLSFFLFLFQFFFFFF